MFVVPPLTPNYTLGKRFRGRNTGSQSGCGEWKGIGERGQREERQRSLRQGRLLLPLSRASPSVFFSCAQTDRSCEQRYFMPLQPDNSHSFVGQVSTCCSPPGTGNYHTWGPSAFPSPVSFFLFVLPLISFLFLSP